MTRKSIPIICIFFLALSAGDARADETAQAFLDGIHAYKAGDYPQAIKIFTRIADSGVKNGKLFYNLGNAHLKNNDLGLAILWYERALKLTPDDPDLKFNHAHALSLTRDEKGDKQNPILRILFFWKYGLSPGLIQWCAAILNLIFWVYAAVRMILNRRPMNTLGSLLLAIALVFMATAFYNYHESAVVKHAVILAPEVPVRSGLTEDATQLFILHAGTKVKIEREMEGFYRIYFSEGKIGWVRKSDAGMI
jgi:tetratricopeptide (TPR) repeat protein